MISAVAFYPITDWLMCDPLELGVLDPGSALAGAGVTELWLCALIGLAVTGGLFVITDYYTSTRFRPVKTISQASVTGPRDQHHPGPRPGLPVRRSRRRC